MRITSSPKSEDKFDIVVSEHGLSTKFTKLLVSLAANEIGYYSFAGDVKTGMVQAKAHGEKGWFFSCAGLDRYKEITWVGGIKFSHAVRISQKFAAQMTRVGLTESE